MPTSPPDDGTLLRRWLAGKDESSFREIVGRYNGLVYHSALRTCGNHATAAEAAQLTFILLARRAPRLASRTSLAGWLHRSALLQTRNLTRSQRREESKRQSLTAMNPDSHSEDIQAWREMAPVLDDALASLPESDREAILLRFYRSLTFPEIAASIGIATEAARKRVDRAVQRLRVQLGRRGCHVGTATCLSALGHLGTDAQAAVLSTALLSSNAIGAASLTTGIFSTTTIAILMTKKVAITAGAALFLAGAGAVALINKTQDTPGTTTASTAENTRPPGGNRADRPASPADKAAEENTRTRARAEAELSALVTEYGEARTNLSKHVAGTVVELLDDAIQMGEMATTGDLARTFGGGGQGLQMGLGRDLTQNLSLTPDQQTQAQELFKEFQKRELERAKSAVENLRQDPETLMRIMLASDAYSRGDITEEEYKAIQNSAQTDLEGIMNPLDRRNFQGGRPLADEAFNSAMLGLLDPDQAQTFQSAVQETATDPETGSIAEMPAMDLESLDKTVTSAKTLTSGVRQMMEGLGGLQDLAPMIEEQQRRQEQSE